MSTRRPSTSPPFADPASARALTAWTVVGLAEDEAVPDKAMTVDEVNRKYQVGEREKHVKAEGRSQVIVEGLNECFYPIVSSLDGPRCSARQA